MRLSPIAVIAAVIAFAGPAAAQAPKAQASGVLTGAEVRTQIVGRMLTSDSGVNWLYFPDGRYEADDGRVLRSGSYQVRTDGRLCWNDRTGVSGCFQFYRKGGELHGRRAEPGNNFELGRLTPGPLPAR